MRAEASEPLQLVEEITRVRQPIPVPDDRVLVQLDPLRDRIEISSRELTVQKPRFRSHGNDRQILMAEAVAVDGADDDTDVHA